MQKDIVRLIRLIKLYKAWLQHYCQGLDSMVGNLTGHILLGMDLGRREWVLPEALILAS